ncbi:MAG: hypothetical protein ACRDLO_14350 [Solirubrobacterales bacterium]
MTDPWTELVGDHRGVGDRTGTLDFGIECAQGNGGIFFNRPTVAAVALSPN